MLDLYRFVNMDDVEDVLLQDRANTEVFEDGMWLSPLGNAAQEWTMSASATVHTDDSSRAAKMVWMEKGRSDSRTVGKMTVLDGDGIRGRTDQFVIGGAYAVGKELTLKLDGGIVKFGLAAPGDIVKGIVFLAPAEDAEGLLHFELRK